MTLDPDRILVALAGDVRDALRRVDALESAGLPGKIDALNANVAALLDAVAELAPPNESGPMPVGYVPNWAVLDREQAAQVWADLVDWCRTVLRPMYAVDIWRPCWYQHARLRIELTWLWANWRYSYEPKAPPTRAAEWHTRWWPHLSKVISEELQHCGPVSERLLSPWHDIPAGHNERDFADDEELGQWILDDCARRPEPEGASGDDEPSET